MFNPTHGGVALTELELFAAGVYPALQAGLSQAGLSALFPKVLLAARQPPPSQPPPAKHELGLGWRQGQWRNVKNK